MSVLPVPSILDEIKEKGIRKAAYETLDRTVERITAGMNIQDIREALRGDKPSRRPNPRLTPHADGFWLHMRPSYFHNSVTGLYPTFRLGWLSTYFFAFEIITGLFLMIFYTPSPDVAYGDMQNIMGNVPLGQLMRDLHRLGAEGMVAVVMLHMIRTFITGSYKKPRQFTWATGVVLLLATLFLSFSGYLLPWDQLAFWAVTIGTSMAEAAPPEVVGTNVNLLLRGSPDIGAGGLLRFYLLHVFAVPLITAIFIGVHYYKVIIHGHSLPPRTEEVGQDSAKRVPMDSRTYYIPDILSNELAWIGLTTFVLIFLSIWFFHAPLENHADPQVTPLHTTAPWYFLWIQGLLKLGDKVFMGIVAPTLIFGLLFVYPYLDLTPSRRYAHRRVALTFCMLFILGWTITTYMGTPFYAVETSNDIEIAQELIPQEGVGTVRAVPYDQWLKYLTVFDKDDTVWVRDLDALKAQDEGYLHYDEVVEPYAITITPDKVFIPEGELSENNELIGEVEIREVDIDDLEEELDDAPDLAHAIEEFHDILYGKYSEGLNEATGYLSISQNQDNLIRIYLLISWNGPTEEGVIQRQISGKTVQIHKESEWHEH